MSPVPANVTLRSVIRQFLLGRKISNVTSATLEWYGHRFKHFWPDQSLPLSDLTLPMIRERIGELMDTEVTVRTINGDLQAVKALLFWAQDEEYEVNVNPRKLKLLRDEERIPRCLGPEEIGLLLQQPDQSRWTGKRDHCFMCLLLDTGIRISEALGIKLEDVDQAEGTVRVRGKSRRERVVAMSASMRKTLRRWIREGQPERWLFPTDEGGQLARYTAYERVTKYAKKAGVEGVHPHAFRSTFATYFCRQGGSLVHLQTILGHTTLEMSRMYAAVVDEDAFNASRILSPLTAIQGA